MIKSSKAFGMMPEDLLVAGAISKGFEDLKNNPYLLDYCFNWLSNDSLTKDLYGDKEKERIKKWFLNTKFIISPSTLREDELRFPLIAIHLESSVDDAATLGDVHYDTTDEVPESESGEMRVQPNIIIGPFTPKTYDTTTGLIVLPDGLNTNGLFANQILVDKINKNGYPILEINGSDSFLIEKGTVANFTDAYVAPIDSFTVVSLESIVMKQTYSIGCYIQNEPQLIMYLSTIVRFIIHRYKEILLEERGFERTSVSMTGPYLANGKFPGYPEGEQLFGQNFTVTGYVRETWPKAISPKIQGINIKGIKYLGGTSTPDSYLKQVEDQGWWQFEDPLPSE